MSRIYRWHPKISSDLGGPVVRKAALHLQQSDIDNACGIHCILMSLLAFGIVQRDDVEELSKATSVSLGGLWESFKPFYFVGAKPRQLKSFLDPYKGSVRCKVFMKNPIPNAIKTLEVDGMCIVGLRGKDFRHWVLAIGTGSKEERGDVETLLILDPSIPPIPLLPWNAVLTVKAGRRDKHRYATEFDTTKLIVESVLTLTRDFTEIDFDLDGELALLGK